MSQTIIIVGASARAAAFSALRAGLSPWCLDLFADEDLKARCPVKALDHATYPQCLLTELPKAPPGPWMYTGGLENHPKLVAELARQRPLWGNDAGVLRKVRDPVRLAETLREAGLPVLEVRTEPPPTDTRDRWLVKPLRGAGGNGIRVWDGSRRIRNDVYYQQFKHGESVSAVFACGGEEMMFFESSRQLVGVPWLNANRFSYCGSIHRAVISEKVVGSLSEIARLVASRFQLAGLFGIDFIGTNDAAMLVEVNPRYTASMELAEFRTGFTLMHWHQQAFQGSFTTYRHFPRGGPNLGKAIYFAPRSLLFPDDGPWVSATREQPYWSALPDFADVPAPGTRIEKGWPVLTFFARGSSDVEVETALRQRATELEELLFADLGPM